MRRGTQPRQSPKHRSSRLPLATGARGRDLPGLEAKRHQKRIVLSHSLDGLSRRYGRDTVTYGIQPPIEAEFISTKIAFTRIPEREEFYE